jgi:hypothetical protein
MNMNFSLVLAFAVPAIVIALILLRLLKHRKPATAPVHDPVVIPGRVSGSLGPECLLQPVASRQNTGTVLELFAQGRPTYAVNTPVGYNSGTTSRARGGWRRRDDPRQPSTGETVVCLYSSLLNTRLVLIAFDNWSEISTENFCAWSPLPEISSSLLSRCPRRRTKLSK